MLLMFQKSCDGRYSCGDEGGRVVVAEGCLVAIEGDGRGVQVAKLKEEDAMRKEKSGNMEVIKCSSTHENK